MPISAYNVFIRFCFLSSGHRAHTVFVGVHVPGQGPTSAGGHRKRSHHRRHRHHKNGSKDDKDDDRPRKYKKPLIDNQNDF